MTDSPITRARKAAGLTQSELARRIGVSRSQLCDWEAGRRHPKIENLEKIADALGVEMISMLAWQKGGAKPT